MKKSTFIGLAWTMLIALICALAIAPAGAFAATSGNSANKPQQAPALVSTMADAASDQAPATGEYLEDGAVYLISSALAGKNKVTLNVAGGSTSAGANVELRQRNNTFAQFWQAKHQGNGVYQFVSYSGSHKLAINGMPTSGANVLLADSGNVDWRLQKNSDNTYSLVSADNSKLRVAVKGSSAKNGANVRVAKASSAQNQKFYFGKLKAVSEAAGLPKTFKNGTYELVVKGAPSMRLDVKGASKKNKANVQLGKYTKLRASQKWQLNYVSNGLYTIKNMASGKLLDIANRSTKLGANVLQQQADDALSQMWYFKPRSDGSYEIKSALSGRSLYAHTDKAAAGTNIKMGKSGAGALTQGYTIKASKLVPNGTYVLSTALGDPMVLDVKSGSSANGANVQTYRSNGTAAQKFKIKHVGGGKYIISNASTGKVVEVASGSKKTGANIQMGEKVGSKGSKAQQWIAEPGSGGGFRFKSVASGKYLAVKGARLQSGTNVVQNTGKGASQSWVLHTSSWRFYPKKTSFNDLKVLVKAEQYEGMPYQWGGRSPSTSFDCAGIVMYCSNAVWGTNFDLMYTNADRLLNDRYYNHGRVYRISASEAKPGDLVFYRGTYGSDINYISHVVFYAGRGYMYGAGDPIGYDRVDAIKNFRGQKAVAVYARIRH